MEEVFSVAMYKTDGNRKEDCVFRRRYVKLIFVKKNTKCVLDYVVLLVTLAILHIIQQSDKAICF